MTEQEKIREATMQGTIREALSRLLLAPSVNEEMWALLDILHDEGIRGTEEADSAEIDDCIKEEVERVIQFLREKPNTKETKIQHAAKLYQARYNHQGDVNHEALWKALEETEERLARLEGDHSWD